MKTSSTAQRQADLRARRTLLGLKEVRGLWLPRELHAPILAYARRIRAAQEKRRSKP